MILAIETPNGLERVELPNDEERLNKIMALHDGIPKGVVVILGFDYPVVIRDGNITCGCETRTIQEWTDFSQRDLAEMEGTKSARFWRRCRDVVLMAANALYNS